MKLIFFFIYVILTAAAFGLLEIQMEGKNGWASKLPCWRPKGRLNKAIEWVTISLGASPLTGYHLIFWLLFFPLMIHLPVFFTSSWSWRNEMTIWGFMFLIIPFEDFFWFVFNPHFGIKNFRENNPNLYWHKKWFLGVPLFYWLWIPLGLLFTLTGFAIIF